jgi:hypothetical protein
MGLKLVNTYTRFSTVRNARYSDSDSMERGGQAVDPSARKLSIQVHTANETEMCGSAIIHEVQFLMNYQWHVGQEIKNVFSKKTL